MPGKGYKEQIKKRNNTERNGMRVSDSVNLIDYEKYHYSDGRGVSPSLTAIKLDRKKNIQYSMR